MTRSSPRAAVYREGRADQSAGSITVFAALSLLLVASFLLTLLEAARVKGLYAYAAMNRLNAMESVFSEYERTIYDNYGVFLLDGGYKEGTVNFAQIHSRLQRVSQENLRPVSKKGMSGRLLNFYQMKVSDCRVREYMLATDDEGMPFRMNATAGMRIMLPDVLADEFTKRGEHAREHMAQAQGQQSLMERASEQIEAAKKSQGGTTANQDLSDAPQQEVQPEVENPIDTVKELRKKDLLSLVLPEGAVVSTKQLVLSKTLEHRTLQGGTDELEKKDDLSIPYLYNKYLQTYFSSYANPKDPLICPDGTTCCTRALDYEQEYIISGKESDRKNLKAVVEELLLLREGINYAYLQTDVAKQNEARAIATAILSATGMLAMVEAVTQGILAAWAFAESILEIRTLLAGGHIAWVKTAADWSSDIKSIGALLSGGARAKEQPQGDGYDDYLEKLLYLKTTKQLNYRAMDMIEQTLRNKADSVNLSMDAMLVSMSAHFTYESAPLFSKMVTIRNLSREDWKFEQDESYTYLP